MKDKSPNAESAILFTTVAVCFCVLVTLRFTNRKDSEAMTTETTTIPSAFKARETAENMFVESEITHMRTKAGISIRTRADLGHLNCKFLCPAIFHTQLEEDLQDEGYTTECGDDYIYISWENVVE